MEFAKIHNKGQARLFKNQYIEYLTKTHPLVIWGMYMPVIILLPYYSSRVQGFSNTALVLFFIGGMFFWSFTEYILHRFAFHYHAESERGKKLNYILHGNHHEYPRDRERLFIIENVFVHIYGKKETRPGRKMGHITILSKEKQELIHQANRIKQTVKVLARS